MRKVLYILGELNDDDVEWMAAIGRKRLARNATQTLIRQGEPAADLLFVLDGHAVVSVDGVGEIARLGTGEVVGELSFVDSAPPSANVVAEPGCVTLSLDKRAITERLRGDAGFSGRFYRALAMFLADRLRDANVRHSATADLSSRVIDEDELDEALLDNVSLAGLRFERMLEILSNAPLAAQ